MSQPTVAVVVPCRNAGSSIGACLEALRLQTYPAARVEVVVSDGRSTDDTRHVVARAIARDPRVRLVDNDRQSAAAGLNRAIASTTADVIIRVDAHTTVSPDFVERSVAVLQARPDASCVGGPVGHRGRGATGAAIAAAMSHPFGVGNATHRFAGYEGYADAVAMPTCWRSTLVRLGRFDERFIRNEDDDFYLRVTGTGGRLFISPTVRYTYWVRDRFAGLFRQYLQYGYWKLAVVRKHRRPASLRMFAPTLLLGATGASLLSAVGGWGLAAILLGAPGVAYGVISIAVAVAARRRHSASTAWRLPVAFAMMHAGYGIGLGLALVRWLVGLADHAPAGMVALTR